MNSTLNTLRPRCLLTSLCAVIVVFTSAYPQHGMQLIATDPRMVVIPWRTLAEIDSDIGNAQITKQLAMDRKARAEGRALEIEKSIANKDVASKDADRRKDEAKKAGRASEAIGLQSEVKANKQAVNLLKRLKDLRKAEIEEAEVEVDRTDLDIRVLEMEKELLNKRTEYNALVTSGGGDLTLNTAQQILGDLEVRLLQLQKERASATEKLASKQKDIVSRRMKLHDAQVKLGMPRM
jgi:hypothetical protein